MFSDREFSSFFFSSYTVYVIYARTSCISSLTFLYAGSFVEILLSSISIMDWVSYKVDSPGVYSFTEIPVTEHGFEKFFPSSEILSYFFFHLHLFGGVHFQYSQILVIFLFSLHFDSFLVWQFCSFRFN